MIKLHRCTATWSTDSHSVKLSFHRWNEHARISEDGKRKCWRDACKLASMVSSQSTDINATG